MKKKVFLIGLNLYSIFLSLKIKSQYKNYDVIILEGSKSFLKAYNHVKIDKYKVNPGFHTFEDIRSNSLLNFLEKTIKFYKIKKTRGMIIGKDLISCQDSVNKWPNNIKKKFQIRSKNISHKNKKKSLSNSEKKYVKYLKNCFSDSRTSFNDAIDLSYPWFFPPNYKEESKDEASIFNQKVRERKINHKYVFPEGGLFENISFGLKKLLKKKGVKIKLNKPVKFIKKNNKIFFDGCEELNKSSNFKIICIPVKPLSISIINKENNRANKLTPIKFYTGLIEVKNFEKSKLDNFVEVIVASEHAVGLKRISLYSDILKMKKKIYQIEFLENYNEPDLYNQLNKILLFMSKFIKFKNKKSIKIIGYSFVRNVFRPKNSYMNYLKTKTIKFFENEKNLIFPRQILWPVNSNKHFSFANIDYEKVINKKFFTKK